MLFEICEFHLFDLLGIICVCDLCFRDFYNNFYCCSKKLFEVVVRRLSGEVNRFVCDIAR
jgi:hypothetical protein